MNSYLKNALSFVMDEDSSSSSSEDDEVFFKMIEAKREKRKQRLKEEIELLHTHGQRKISKVQNYFETINYYQPDIFKSHFRLNREEIQRLAQRLGPKFQSASNDDRILSLEKHLLVTVWTLANIESFRGIADRFGIAKSTAHQVFLKTCSLIASETNYYIKWPTDYFAAARKFSELRNKKLPGIIGAVDGVDIEIEAPINDKASYYNRKGKYAIKMQGICDANCRFIDVFIGYPGACHDAAMWTASPVSKMLKEENVDSQFHLVGDSAYPLEMYLMKPYRDTGHLTTEQKQFNQILSSHRVVIENAYGLLKGKYRRLKHLHMFLLDDIPKVIATCCILHNIGLNEQDDVYLDSCSVLNEITNNEQDSGELSSNCNERNANAEDKRNFLCSLLAQDV